jgi:phosphate transport system protein
VTKHLERDLDAIRKSILTMGALVEDATNKAIVAIADRRPELAEEVRRGDNVLDDKEIEVEEACLKVLALHQPVAKDLRFIIAVMKVNNDLERMGDLAVNMAERALILSSQEPLPFRLGFDTMGEKVRAMVKESLDALVNVDVELAWKVCADDDAVDTMHRELFSVVQNEMMRRPEIIERGVSALSASRHLERIADLATNIAEDVVFMAEGEIIRHGRDPRVDDA